MTLDEFRQTLAAGSAPPLSPLLRALWYDAKGDWDEAHRIAQDVSGADGAWVHAYLERVNTIGKGGSLDPPGE